MILGGAYKCYTCMHVYQRVSIDSLCTSVKIIQLNEYGCRDAPCEKSWKQGNPLSNTIKDTRSCVTLCLNYVGRVTHDCASILDSIAKGISLFPRFFSWCIPTSIFIQLNDFYTCSSCFSWFVYKRSYKYAATRIYMYKRCYRAYARMRTCVALRLYHVLV